LIVTDQAATAGTVPPGGVRRLNWGCGSEPVPGWLNSDIKAGPGAGIACDLQDGRPFDDASIDYVVGIHSLPELPHPDIEPALRELYRVLEVGGVLRLSLPDLDRAIRAYLDREVGYFLVPDDDVRSLGGKLVVQMSWYGHSRSLYTFDFIEELLYRAGFRRVARCAFRDTASAHPEIVELDDRERESLFVEAFK
jgi:predicted SAM-dependent methyltransferase